MSVGKVPQEWIAERNKKRNEWFLGNQQACNFIEIVMEAFELTDDLIDNDKSISDERILRDMMWLLIELPNNTFFIEHRTYLTPFIFQTASAWHDSETLKKSKDESLRRLAFNLRNYGLELYHATAFCVGGWEHLRKVSTDMRTFFAIEKYKEWEYA